jgi:hypothetical protein
MKRLGPNEDGGYVVYEKLLAETDVLLTYGVGNEVRFEEHFNSITGKKVLMFDPTMFGRYLLSLGYCKWLLVRFQLRAFFNYLVITRHKWIKKKQLAKKNILFFNEGLAATPYGKYDTLAHHLERFQLFNNRILLKIDIEGTEYEVFESADFMAALQHVNQLLVEFHFITTRFDRFKKIIEQLKTDFEIIHIHANNFAGVSRVSETPAFEHTGISMPESLEITFIKKDKIMESEVMQSKTDYPIANLDYPNDPVRADLKLDFM